MSHESQHCEDKHCSPSKSDCHPKLDCCPVEMKAKMLQHAFLEAMHQAHVCALKKKIEERFVDEIDKSTDIVIEQMHTEWKSKLASIKLKQESLEKLKASMLSSI